MANPYDKYYYSFDNLYKDPKNSPFINHGNDGFVPDNSDGFIPDPPEKQNRPENVENLLQRVIKNARLGPFGGTSITAILPTSGQEAMDLGKVALRQVVPDQSGMVGLGAKMAGVEGDINLPSPETDYGKNLETSANIAQGIHAIGAVAPLVKEGVSAITKPFRVGPINKEIKSIEDLIANSKASEAPVRDELTKLKDYEKSFRETSNKQAKSIGYEGSKAIKEQVAGRFRDANQRFGEEFQKISSQMGDEDIAKVIKNAANDIGATDIPGSPGNQLMSKASKYGPKKSIGQDGVPIEQLVPRIYDKEQVQAITKDIYDSLPTERAKAIFNKHLADALPSDVPGLKELKSSHAPIYKIAKEAKGLNRGALTRAASGTAIDAEINDLGQSAEKLGTSQYERAKKIGEKNKLQKYAINQKKSNLNQKLVAKSQEQISLNDKIPALERKIKDVRFRQALTGGIASALGIGGGLLSRIFHLEHMKD